MGAARDGPRRPSRGAIGGSSNEAGAAFRSGVAAWIITHGLRGRELPYLQLTNNQAVPVMVALEADYPVDDMLSLYLVVVKRSSRRSARSLFL
jgi:hypothetical protein